MALLQNWWNSIVEGSVSYVPSITFVLIALVVGWFVIRLIVKLVEKFFSKVDFERGMETFIENGIRVILWIILFIVILANLGVDVSAMVAGLGILGFVVGFALKDTLGNLASGFFILFYKPFKVGDFVRAGGINGTVHKIGVAACELSSPDNIKITIPNNKIWGDVIENFTGNKIRKMFNLEVGISYSSDIDKAIKIINTILKKDKRILKDPEPQVVVRSLGDSSVNIAIRPSMKREDFWGVYFDNLKKIKEAFDRNDIEIPFPQRDVHIKETAKPRKRERKK